MQLLLKKIRIILLVMLASSSIAMAQVLLNSSDSLKIPIELIGTELGLSQGMINGISQDRQGYLWIATKDGLNRYDGKEFRVFRNDPDDPYSLAENYIRSIYIDSRNLIWVGTNSSGLNLFDRSTEKFIPIGKDPELGTSKLKHIIRILEDAAGNIVIYDESAINPEIIHSINYSASLTKLRYKISKLNELYAMDNSFSKNFNANQILGFSRDSTMWYHQNGALYKIYPRNGFQNKHSAQSPNLIYKKDKSKIYQPYYFDRNRDNLYLLEDENRILKLDPSTNIFKAYLKVPKKYTLDFVLTFIDHSDRFWTTDPQNKILRIDPKSALIQEMPYLVSKEGIPFGLLFNKTCEDKQHNLWIGTGGFGMVKISSRTNHFKLLNIPRPEYEDIRRIYSYDKNENQRQKLKANWLKCKDRLMLNTKGAKFNFTNSNLASDKNQFIWSVVTSADKSKHHLIKINPANANFEIKASQAYETSESFGSPLFTAQNGDIWFGERASGKNVSLYHYNPQLDTLEQFKFPVEVLLSDQVFISHFYINPENKFWLATKQGLFSFDPATQKWQHFHFNKNDPQSLSNNTIISICPDPEQPNTYLWLGTDGGGLNKFNIEAGKFERFSTKNGLPNNVIYAIQSDHKHNLWMSTNNGLCLFDPKTLQTRNFTIKDGLPGNEFNRNDCYKTADGILYFGGINGVIVFDPDVFYEKTNPSDIYINKFKLSNKEILYHEAGSTPLKNAYKLNAPIENCTQLEFKHDHGMITLGFTLMDLTNPEANRYKYILENLNQDWIDAGNNNEATFTNLPPGKYTFKVSGCNNDNVWSVTPASLEIIVLPPWWATWWFRISLLLVTGSGIYLFYRYRLHHLMKLQLLRNRIAADLHDEIGSTLSSISLASSAIQYKLKDSTPEVNSLLNRISSNTDEMMEAMSDIVWAVNTKNDRFDNVIHRMKAFSIETLEPLNIQIHFLISPQLNRLTLDMQQRKNLYLVFKEAITNVAKYADCQNLWLELEHDKGILSMTIKDDGKGFNLDRDNNLNTSGQQLEVISNHYGGSGINNMKKRAEELKGKLSINSALGKGTTVILEFKVM